MEDPAIARAETVLEWLSCDQETLRLYELREKALHDEVTRFKGALAEGRAKGIAEGEAKGKLEGRAEGRAEGKLEGKIEIAQNMLLKGTPDDLVAEITGLPIDRVRKIK